MNRPACLLHPAEVAEFKIAVECTVQHVVARQQKRVAAAVVRHIAPQPGNSKHGPHLRGSQVAAVIGNAGIVALERLCR